MDRYEAVSRRLRRSRVVDLALAIFASLSISGGWAALAANAHELGAIVSASKCGKMQQRQIAAVFGIHRFPSPPLADSRS